MLSAHASPRPSDTPDGNVVTMLVQPSREYSVPGRQWVSLYLAYESAVSSNVASIARSVSCGRVRLWPLAAAEP